MEKFKSEVQRMIEAEAKRLLETEIKSALDVATKAAYALGRRHGLEEAAEVCEQYAQNSFHLSDQGAGVCDAVAFIIRKRP